MRKVRFLLASVLCFAGVSTAVQLSRPVPLIVKATQIMEPEGNRTLTFADRVAYQLAIEEVYWRHRIWPKENPDSKPSLDSIMSQAQLEKKVTDYLLKSQALEDYWHQPISAEQLQVEMDRMAQHTRQPDVLRELFEALGNDPFVIAECLARPVLAERLLVDSCRSDRAAQKAKESVESWLSSAETQVRNVTIQDASYALPVISGISCIDDTWTATSTTNAPTARYYHTAVWTGSEMIIWGGLGSSGDVNTGGRYNPATDTWIATTTTNAPDARDSHTAVWTGSEMIVWGGGSNVGNFNTGGRYNPSTDSWTSTTTTNAPTARSVHTAVWTGSEMIVWGGYLFNGSSHWWNTGGRYNPGTDSWIATTTTNAPTGRSSHTAIWTGTQMIVWGGNGAGSYFNTGGTYNPGTDSWAATSITNAPTARIVHTAIWTGSEVIIWGGFDGNNHLDTGGRYNPGTDSWTATSLNNAPSARDFHTAVWTDTEMIVWGGEGGAFIYLNTGGRYNPSADSWTATTTTGAPNARRLQTAVWTGSQMVIWGGTDDVSYFNTGGRYCAQSGATPTPTPTPTATATATPIADSNGHTNCYSYANAYTDSHGDSDACTKAFSHAKASPNTAATSIAERRLACPP